MSVRILESWPFVTMVGFILRWTTSLHPYSGAGKPPLYGDYEAQRHWQEVTVNLPVNKWYTNSSDNDLLYWGLDYPPLTAYHSYANGLLANLLNPSFVELHKSRGYESYEHKLFMRYTVFIVDLLLYVPAALLFRKFSVNKLKASASTRSVLDYLALMFYPGIYIIDYGHFQYNNASLGFFIAAVAALLNNNDCIGSALFCLALNYKQMELYRALPVFFFLLGKCLREESYKKSLLRFSMIGGTVVLSFIVLWAPYLYDSTTFLQVVNRVFPINRGLFEDKVANIWCSLSIIIKFKTLFNNSTMALICLCCTGLFSIPSCIHLFKNPTRTTFKYSLVNVSFVFFLFSYHVHEKSILLVTLPACLIFSSDPMVVSWLFLVSQFSMLPLLDKDGLFIAFLCTSTLLLILNYIVEAYCAIARYTGFNKRYATGMSASVILMTIVTVIFKIVSPPSRYPDIFSVLIAIISCAHFCGFLSYFYYKQLTYSSLKLKRK